MAELTPGSLFGAYRIDGVIARGGMGVVYRATQLNLERPVALKLIAPNLAEDPQFRERFVRESRTAAAIDHPNVVPIHEAGDFEGRLFISMRLVEGTDLRAVLRAQGALEPRRALRIVAQVASALDAAHQRGLVHRDVKPANVLLVSPGDSDHAYLTDFGLAKRVSADASVTRTGHFVGTADYASPEQITGGQTGPRSDVYSLGCLLYDALTGSAPFGGRSEVATLFAHVHETPPRPSAARAAVPAALDAVVERAMAKRPEDRYPTAGARAGATEEALNAPAAGASAGAAPTAADYPRPPA